MTFAQAWPFEFDAMGAVDDAVQDRIAEGGVADEIMPTIDGNLAGDQQGALLVAVIDDFEQIPALLGGERLRPPVIDDQQLCAFQGCEHPGQPAFAACRGEVALQNKAVVYDILFKAAAQTVRMIAADPKHLGAETGMIAVLHTWGQNLFHHPHIHCIVPGGGLAPDGRWVACRPGFFLSVRVLSRLYRRLFLERLQAAFDAGDLSFFGNLVPLAEAVAFAKYLQPLRRLDWVVYAKRPFAGPQPVLDYLGRYTHRVAIANSRLIDLADGQVRFRWKDYRQPDKPKVMTLQADEFIRRFLLHVLPDGFRRIRHFGCLANAITLLFSILIE